MAVWDELKVILAGLRDQQPGVLNQYPTLEGHEGRQPPFTIGLAPWAVTVAEQLHRQFGEDVNLTVGVLSYPPGRRAERSPAAGQLPELLDPREIAAELDGPAVVKSGHALRHGLLLCNQTDRELQIETTGYVTAVVIDPQTHEAVSGPYGWQIQPLVIFRIGPGETGLVPLLIETASTTFRLGYLVPAGSWGVQATLTLGADPRGSLRRRTPVLPLTVTS